MGMRGAVTQEALEDAEKKRFFLDFINNHQLSWVVGKFSSSDRWALKEFRCEVGENGVLEVIDIQFEQIVYVYAAAGIDWHTVRMEYRTPDLPDQRGEWAEFLPSEQFHSWLTYQPKPNA